MQVLTVGNTGTRCMFHSLLMSYVSRLGQIENISFCLPVAITGGLCLFYGVLGWLSMWVDGLGRASGICLETSGWGIWDGTGAGRGLFRKCDTTSSFLSYI